MARYRVKAACCQDIGSRSSQQDAMDHSRLEDFDSWGVMAVLADGMGGMMNGEKFAGIAVREMLEWRFDNDPSDDICQDLYSAYTRARKRALESIEGPEPEGGSTVAAVLAYGTRCAFLSVGDSRIYLLRGKGLIQLNREHVLGKRLDELAALGYIPRREAEMNVMRGALLNHLCSSVERVEGNVYSEYSKRLLECDCCKTPFRIRSGDKIALMSDGVFGTLSEQEILRFMSMDGVDGAQRMIDAIKARGVPRQDNCSVVMLAFEARPRHREVR